MKQVIKLTTIALLVVALGACTTTKSNNDASGSTNNSVSDADAQARALAERRRVEEAERARLAEQARIAALLNSTTIYFAFNQDDLNTDYTEMLQLHAERMVKEGRSVVLEGHADERGTPEYNLALGERRAKTIAQILRTFGVASSQIEVVSFGEESPARDGHTEADWAKNRRVELNYK